LRLACLRTQAYRGPGGSYTIRKHRPIFFGEFINDEKMRQRYWARSYLGEPRALLSRPLRLYALC